MNKLVLATLMTASMAVGSVSAQAARGPTPTPTPPPPPLSTFTTGSATVYASRAAFNAAVTGAVTNDFEGIASPTSGGIGVQQYASGSFTDNVGNTFLAPTTGSVINLGVLDKTYLNGAGQVNAHFGSDVLTTNYENLTINFDHAVTSFAIDYASLGRAFANQSDTFSFTVAGLGTQQAYSNGSGLSFFGFTSNTAFNSITISALASGSSASNRFFDNIATAAPVPEPGEWAMMVGGLGLVGGVARRRKARAA